VLEFVGITRMCESELEEARELIKESEARLKRGNKNGQEKTDAAGEEQPKRRRG
jgi:hypothetical protein